MKVCIHADGIAIITMVTRVSVPAGSLRFSASRARTSGCFLQGHLCGRVPNRGLMFSASAKAAKADKSGPIWDQLETAFVHFTFFLSRHHTFA